MVGFQHLRMKFQFQKIADLPQHSLRFIYQFFKPDRMAPLPGYISEELFYVLLADCIDQFCQFSDREVVTVSEEDLIQPGLLEGVDHCIGMAQQVYVSCILKIA